MMKMVLNYLLRWIPVGNQTSERTVADVLNRMLNDAEDGFKATIQEIVLASGETLEVKDSDGFLVFSIDEFGNIRHTGDIIKIW